MNYILEEAFKLQEQLILYRRHLHQHPELGMDVDETSAFVEEQLIRLGYVPERISHNGLVAYCGGHTPGKTVLLRGDMDALPIQEQTGLAFKSCNNNMHACGHDFHMAMLLGAAQILKAHEGEIKGLVKIMFQPAEENIIGALDMIKAGVLENPPVDMALMIHLFPNLELESGTLLIPKKGPTTLAADWFNIEILGRGGHGAMPHTTIDPLNVAAHIHIALQSLNARECPPTQTSIVTIGMMAGGDIGNVIPDKAVMKGTVRTFQAANRKRIKQRIQEIAKGVGTTFGAEVHVEIIDGCPSIVCDEKVVDSVTKAMKELLPIGGYKQVEDIFDQGKILFSEDFAYITEKCPGAILLLGAGHSKDGFDYPLHHPKVMFDEAILYKGAAIHAFNALFYLQ